MFPHLPLRSLQIHLYLLNVGKLALSDAKTIYIYKGREGGGSCSCFLFIQTTGFCFKELFLMLLFQRSDSCLWTLGLQKPWNLIFVIKKRKENDSSDWILTLIITHSRGHGAEGGWSVYFWTASVLKVTEKHSSSFSHTFLTVEMKDRQEVNKAVVFNHISL